MRVIYERPTRDKTKQQIKSTCLYADTSEKHWRHLGIGGLSTRDPPVTVHTNTLSELKHNTNSRDNGLVDIGDEYGDGIGAVLLHGLAIGGDV